jgi:hypothetical protein
MARLFDLVDLFVGLVIQKMDAERLFGTWPSP